MGTVYYVTASWVPYDEHYVILSFPLCGGKVHPAQTMYNSTASYGDRKKKKKTVGTLGAGCLAHVVSGTFYSVLANRRQPNLYIYVINVQAGLAGGVTRARLPGSLRSFDSPRNSPEPIHWIIQV